MTLAEALQQAIDYHQAGQLAQAEAVYRAILHAQPHQPDAQHNLGVLLVQMHKNAEALVCFTQALHANPKQPQFWLSYLTALIHAGQFETAREVIANARAAGISDERFSAWEAYLAAPTPDELSQLNHLFAQKKFPAAASLARDLILRFPEHGISYKLLAAILLQQQCVAEALALAHTAVDLLPEDAGAHYTFAVALKQQGDLLRAEQHCAIALTLQPDYTAAHYTLGIIRQYQGRLQDAVQCFQQAIALNPADEEVYNNLALILRDQYRFAEAEQCYRTVLAMQPEYAPAHNNLGMLLQHQGRLTEAESCYRAALNCQVDDANIYSNLLYLHHYSAVYSVAERVQEARNYGGMVAKKVLQKFNTWLCEARPQKLRVGLVSGDFREHVVSYFLDTLFAHSNKNTIEWFAYSTNAITDRTTERLKSYVAAWEVIACLSDAAAAERIHADGIHILFDLSGHTNHNRLPIFAYKPAPIQVSWLGYWATTGVAEMDFIWVDEVGVPAQNHWHFTEKIYYLPDTRLCFCAPQVEITVSDLPALSKGYLTFGCFQNLTKVTSAVLKVWGKILTCLPTARLRFQAKQLHDPAFVAMFYAQLAAHGIVAERVSVHGSGTREDYLLAYQDVDMILDTFPFPGGTTTCEALWMGVPTLTLAGETLIARQGASLLAAAGLSAWIVDNEQDYIQQAVVLAENLDYLAQLRAGLRAQVLASPLFDGERFAHNFEYALWYVWQIAQPSPDLQQSIENIVTLFNQQCYAQAEPLARALTLHFPEHFFGWKALGAILQSVGRLQESLLAQKKSVALCEEADGFYNLGITYKALGDVAAAEDSYQRALALNPNHAQAWSNLGMICQELQRFPEAQNCYVRAIALNPDYAQAYNNLGHLLRQLGDLQAAEQSYRQALAINPQYTKALNNLGCTLKELNRPQEAEQCYRQAIEIKPDYADAYNNLGILLQESAQLYAAEQCYRLALQYQADLIEAYSNLGNVLKDQGRLQDAEQTYLAALALDPQFLVAQHNLLYTYHYSTQHTAEFCLAAAKQFGQLVSAKVKQPFREWCCQAQPKRLRIGWVSGDFYEHAVCFFLENLLAHLTDSSLELIAYPTHTKQDALTERIKPYFCAWKPLVGLSDEAAAQLIHADGVHILFDLAGHTAHNRLPVFAYKPAPLQVTWLGYFATTGVAEIDVILVDKMGVPEKNRWHFTEQICYLADTRLCFSPPKVEIAVAPLPALANGYITFGCFQNFTKVTDNVLAVWAKILLCLPNAQLRLQSKQLDDAAVVASLYARLAAYGISRSRVQVYGSRARVAYLAAHAEVDIILDTFPYTGGTTTCEALWMGVPTLTLAGDTLLARQGASLLAAAGLPDWIVDSEDSYIRQAIVFSQDINFLAALRQRLREQVMASPLLDGERFARHFTHTLWQLYQDFKANFAHSHATIATPTE